MVLAMQGVGAVWLPTVGCPQRDMSRWFDFYVFRVAATRYVSLGQPKTHRNFIQVKPRLERRDLCEAVLAAGPGVSLASVARVLDDPEAGIGVARRGEVRITERDKEEAGREGLRPPHHVPHRRLD